MEDDDDDDEGDDDDDEDDDTNDDDEEEEDEDRRIDESKVDPLNHVVVVLLPDKIDSNCIKEDKLIHVKPLSVEISTIHVIGSLFKPTLRILRPSSKSWYREVFK